MLSSEVIKKLAKQHRSVLRKPCGRYRFPLSCMLCDSYNAICHLSCQHACMSHVGICESPLTMLIPGCSDDLLSSTKQSSFLNFYVLSRCRLKGRPADIPDGGVKNPPTKLGDKPSTHTSDKHTDTHITLPHHCEMNTSRLPTLPEEETSDLKTPDPVPMVREEADGKDDVVEVNIQNNDKT